MKLNKKITIGIISFIIISCSIITVISQGYDESLAVFGYKNNLEEPLVSFDEQGQMCWYGEGEEQTGCIDYVNETLKFYIGSNVIFCINKTGRFDSDC